MAFFSSSLHPHILILFVLLPFPNNIFAKINANISLGTTFFPLSNPTSWLSPSGDFAFGFLPLQTDPSLFLLAVWFDRTPDKTVVWTANGGNPVTNQSKAELTVDGQLSLKDQTNQEIWNAGVYGATYGSMLNTGNFVLSDAGSGALWQTFKNPTDTILPGQVLNQGSKIYAKLMDDDYARGRFVLTLQDDGNLVMYTHSTYNSYWDTKTSVTGVQLVFNETGDVYLLFQNGSRSSVLPVPEVTGDYYMRATLDPDGGFRQYTFPKSKLSTGSWMIKKAIPSDMCNLIFQTGTGACGFNSYCTLDADGKANCQCPPHYSFIDPARKYKGCKPDFASQICEPGGETLFNLTHVPQVNWPLMSAEQDNGMTETECTDNCLKDCFCPVAIYNGAVNNGTCWKRRFPFSNGMSNTDLNVKAFIKFSTLNNSMFLGPGNLSEGRRDWKTWVIVVSSILVGSVVVNLGLLGACCFVFRSMCLRSPPNSSSIVGTTLCSFTYKELEEATKGFSEELGNGAFSTVYKGVLPSQPRTLVAVKKLKESLAEEVDKDFANEVAAIGQTHHKNLVRLLGFCKDGVHRLMVFEFMSKGPLNKFLFRNDRPEWNQRVQIALGIAGGLAYLHEECRTQIIHCDIKPQNILLDDNLEARISDFGLAKLLKLDQTRTSTGIRGTIGYFAPEWFKNVAINAKVDVYSFGVMLLEMICCRRNFELGAGSQSNATLIGWAKECYRNGRLDLLVEDDEDAKRDGMRLERFVIVGISCIQDEPWLRPSMKKVVQMLEGAVAVSIPPNMYSTGS